VYKKRVYDKLLNIQSGVDGVRVHRDLLFASVLVSSEIHSPANKEARNAGIVQILRILLSFTQLGQRSPVSTKS
jgi:hypothetical protein